VKPRHPETDLILACERRIVNAWPARETFVMGDYVVRAADGYSGRANSASAIVAGAMLDDLLLDQVEAFFRARGLRPCVRVTPLMEDAAAALVEARGYRQKDASLGMVAPVGPGVLPPDLILERVASTAWVRGVSARQTGEKKNADEGLMAIVSRVPFPDAGFATLLVDGRPMGFGMMVPERGMAELGSIVVDAALRGQGHGRRLVAGLMAAAAAAGATTTYLQVDETNAPAIALYRALGFREVYRYRTMVLD
jgi:GNAT superfamily N-acetyltransferase